jgi:hypothetical protein
MKKLNDIYLDLLLFVGIFLFALGVVGCFRVYVVRNIDFNSCKEQAVLKNSGVDAGSIDTNTMTNTSVYKYIPPTANLTAPYFYHPDLPLLPAVIDTFTGTSIRTSTMAYPKAWIEY